MSEFSLGIIETIGLAAAIEAADVCVKSANVILVGYEFAKGDGMTVVKIEGNVGAVKAAIEAAQISAAKVNKVVSAKIIPRPSTQIDILIKNSDTVGLEKNDVALEEKDVEIESTISLELVNSIDTVDEIEEAVELDNIDSEIEDEIPPPEKEEEKIEEIKVEDVKKKDRYTCNICKDPKCSRLKGELKSTCIHYKNN